MPKNHVPGRDPLPANRHVAMQVRAQLGPASPQHKEDLQDLIGELDRVRGLLRTTNDINGRLIEEWSRLLNVHVHPLWGTACRTCRAQVEDRPDGCEQHSPVRVVRRLLAARRDLVDRYAGLLDKAEAEGENERVELVREIALEACGLYDEHLDMLEPALAAVEAAGEALKESAAVATRDAGLQVFTVTGVREDFAPQNLIVATVQLGRHADTVVELSANEEVMTRYAREFTARDADHAAQLAREACAADDEPGAPGYDGTADEELLLPRAFLDELRTSLDAWFTARGVKLRPVSVSFRITEEGDSEGLEWSTVDPVFHYDDGRDMTAPVDFADTAVGEAVDDITEFRAPKFGDTLRIVLPPV